MFEKRLKILLICLTLATLVLVARAFWVQIVRHNYWSAQATILSRKSMTETNRGRILDYKGRELAVDRSCLSLHVDYRVIPFELDLKTKSSKEWLYALARKRLVNRVDGFENKPIAERRKMLDAEIEPLHRDIELMWKKLAKIANLSPEQMDERRREIIRLVETRRRLAWYARYEKAIESLPREENEAWYAWLLGKSEIDIDKYDVEVQEQRETHVILPNITYELRNELVRREAEFPGVVLEAGIQRYYPYGSIACQTLGTLRKVDSKDLVDDETRGEKDPENLKRYFSSDEIGRSGLESMLENRLRGSRGLRVLDTDKQVIEEVFAQPGEDVRITIDIELQRQVEEAFKSVHFRANKDVEEDMEMQGAAVVIDIATGEVRALASYPTYDLNHYDEQYESLSRDVIRRPLANRALTSALEPGSTVKPLIGLGAMTDGLINPGDTIYCDGYLTLGGKRQTFGRCWTMKGFNGTHMEHPGSAPHPNNHLTFADALERSCNVFHETLGNRLGIAGENKWFSAFGLGRVTGIGLRESPGVLPRPEIANRAEILLAAIGQSKIAATPIQMANATATIARNGIWMQPTLLPRRAAEKINTVDLQLLPAALREARAGMINSVNGAAGTGEGARMSNLLVAGKTGSAQTSMFTYQDLDPVTGKPRFDDRNRPIRIVAQLGTHASPNPQIPWYRGIGENEDIIPSHAWMITYAPANNPKIAVVAMVEYGGGGGTAAGSVARKALDACIKQGYLPAASH